jgi:Mg2+-importing ATPase
LRNCRWRRSSNKTASGKPGAVQSAEDILRLSGHTEAADGTIQHLDAATRRTFEATLDGLGAQGYRALGVASRMVDAAHATAVVGDETDLVFAGFAVFLDPPKASAGATIRAMAVAGVAVKVLTGDNEQVSRHVFQQIGVPVTGVLTGAALERMSDEALIGQLPRVNLFCRINPQQKHRVLLALNGWATLSASWVTASTTPQPCTRPMSASPSMARRTWRGRRRT